MTYDRNEATKKCIKIRIFSKQILCMMIVLFFDEKVFSIFFHKSITNVITNIVVYGRSNPNTEESYKEPYERIHRATCTLYSHNSHRYFRGEWEKSGLEKCHDADSCVVYTVEEMEYCVVKCINHRKKYIHCREEGKKESNWTTIFEKDDTIGLIMKFDFRTRLGTWID